MAGEPTIDDMVGLAELQLKATRAEFAGCMGSGGHLIAIDLGRS